MDNDEAVTHAVAAHLPAQQPRVRDQHYTINVEENLYPNTTVINRPWARSLARIPSVEG